MAVPSALSASPSALRVRSATRWSLTDLLRTRSCSSAAVPTGPLRAPSLRRSDRTNLPRAASLHFPSMATGLDSRSRSLLLRLVPRPTLFAEQAHARRARSAVPRPTPNAHAPTLLLRCCAPFQSATCAVAFTRAHVAGALVDTLGLLMLPASWCSYLHDAISATAQRHDEPHAQPTPNARRWRAYAARNEHDPAGKLMTMPTAGGVGARGVVERTHAWANGARPARCSSGADAARK